MAIGSASGLIRQKYATVINVKLQQYAEFLK